jgi:hypothetical protein
MFLDSVAYISFMIFATSTYYFTIFT